MPIVEVRLTGDVGGSDVINSWWYRSEANVVLTNSDLGSVLDDWRAVFEAPLEAFLAVTYTGVSLTAQGYTDAWDRAPYLPLIRSLTGFAGARSTAAVAMSPHVAAVLSARVEPVVPGPQPDGVGGIVDKPVRRGYWSFSPLIQADVDSSGRIPATQIATVVFGNLRNACMVGLTGTMALSPLEPIRVSKPVPNVTRRGYGLIRDATWRGYASTRRSRMYGKGA